MGLETLHLSAEEPRITLTGVPGSPALPGSPWKNREGERWQSCLAQQSTARHGSAQHSMAQQALTCGPGLPMPGGPGSPCRHEGQ